MTDPQSLPETALDLSLDALPVGYTATIAWTAENAEIDAFAAVSGDYNPLHMDPAYATSLGFADRVSHGMLLGAKLSGFIGMVLPGRRCLLLEQTLAFPNAVLPGDRVTLTGEVAEIWPDQSMLRLKVRATKPGAGKPIVVARGSVLCKTLS
jgi:acyl dehydratase